MSQTDPQSARVLAIDDSVLSHRLLKAHLKNESVELHSATCGEQGLKMAAALNPDVILLDVDMDDVNGFDVLRALKDDPATQHIPVIFLSGSCTTEDRVRGLDLGAVDFVGKPFEIAELKARVRSAIRMTRLIKMLARTAQVDALTGLWNRAYFNSRLEQEVAEAVRHHGQVALILGDIDHFKRINDEHGHPMGDRVLEQVARLLSSNRATDITCRYGGEEFALIVPQATAADAAYVAERLRSAIEAQHWSGGLEAQVTMSFGVSDLARASEGTPEALIESADRALYAAKEAGRNRVCTAEPDDAPRALRLSA